MRRGCCIPIFIHMFGKYREVQHEIKNIDYITLIDSLVIACLIAKILISTPLSFSFFFSDLFMFYFENFKVTNSLILYLKFVHFNYNYLMRISLTN